MFLRLVNNRQLLYARIKSLESSSLKCRIWQNISTGRVSQELTVLVDPMKDTITLVDNLEAGINPGLPLYVHFDVVNFAFKATLEKFEDSLRIAIPETLCTNERRDGNRLPLKKGVGVEIEFDGRLVQGEVLDVSEKGLAIKTATPDMFSGYPLKILSVTGIDGDLPKQGFTCHVTKQAVLDRTKGEMEFQFLNGISLAESWGFDIEEKFRAFVEDKEAKKEEIYNICHLSEKEKQMITEEVDKLYDQVKNTKLQLLLKAFMNHKGHSYLKWHSDVTGVLSVTVAKKLDWISDATFKKLILACRLHDVIFAECPRVCEIQNRAEFETHKARLSDNEAFLFEQHPNLSAALATDQMDISGDIQRILLQQKELPDGTGFPSGITHAKISPLSSLFIVCHDVANHLYHSPEKDSKKYCLKLREKYKGQTFYKVINALLEILPE